MSAEKIVETAVGGIVAIKVLEAGSRMMKVDKIKKPRRLKGLR